MQLYPTRATFHVALAGAALVAVGVAARMAPVVAFGGAMVLAVAVGRALALATVTRLRVSGFEMVWSTARRVSRVSRGGEIRLEAELRNRGVDDARGVAIRAVASSNLDVTVEPESIDLPAGAKVRLDVIVKTKRVGRWGLHGMALEVRGTPVGGEGLYEVPLMFANPYGIEVLPKQLHAMILSPRGGRSRRASEAGRPAALAGDGDELRELREHMPGDPFKRIAWKASARRGQLVVREMERDERDVLWILLDASVELWAGEHGKAPLDRAVDEISAVIAKHLSLGDHVGLIVTASRLRTWLTPGNGAAHAMRLAAALASAASMVDEDRSELDENAVAQRVAEHLRPLDPRGLADIPRGNLDLLAARAEGLRSRAPFAPRMPFARTAREQRLRHYLASFGIEVPPRLEGERERTDAAMAAIFEKLATEKKRPSILHVWAPAPSRSGPISAGLRRLRAKRIEVRWTVPSFEASVPAEGTGDPATPPASVGDAVADAVRIRARASRVRGERALKKMGVRTAAFAGRAAEVESKEGPQRRSGTEG
jgi:uncharacterized protein (DUF58 family)